MARVEHKVYRNQYYQGTMSDTNAECILALQNETTVPSLAHCIYDLPTEEVEKIKTDYDKNKILPTRTDYPLGTLRDMQTIGVAFMYYAESCLLGDEVGLGKTVEVAALCNLLELNFSKENKPFRFCFLTEGPSSAQIRDKLIRFTGKYVGLLGDAEQSTVSAYLADNPDKQKYSIVGTHALLNSQDFAVYCARHPFDLFVIDESFILKNNTTTIYYNAKAILKYCKRKVLLNATPLETAVRDFYNQLLLLDTGYLPTVANFERDFCRKTKVGNDLKICGTKNEELFRQVIKLRYLARTRVGLGAKFESNHSEVYVIEPSATQKALLKRSSLYQMIADYPPDVDINIPFSIDVAPKMRATLDILKRLDMTKERAIIYCHLKNCQYALQKLLQEQGYTVEVINGSTKKKERDAIIADVTSGKTHILVTNVVRGIDLNECAHCIMYTIDKNPGKLLQVEGRITRDFDVCFRNLYLLVLRGREEKALQGVVSERIKTAQGMTVVGKSISMDAISDPSTWIYLDYYKNK